MVNVFMVSTYFYLPYFCFLSTFLLSQQKTFLNNSKYVQSTFTGIYSVFCMEINVFAAALSLKRVNKKEQQKHKAHKTLTVLMKRNTSPAFEWSSRWKLLWYWPGFGVALLLHLHDIRLFDPKKMILFLSLKSRGCVE